MWATVYFNLSRSFWHKNGVQNYDMSNQGSSSYYKSVNKIAHIKFLIE